jgi:hypothetical protein
MYPESVVVPFVVPVPFVVVELLVVYDAVQTEHLLVAEFHVYV